VAYKKWVANRDRHNDWVSELVLKDGTQLKMGQPVELKADQLKELEEQGRIFEDSSAEEAKEAEQAPQQQPGADVRGAAPVFVNAGESNQQTDQADDDDKPARKREN
jgi:hypothetical protein